MGHEPLITTTGLSKRYGRRIALSDFALRLDAGRITVLVGPNGSGKTTLLRAIAGLIKPTTGKVTVLGRDPWRERTAVMGAVRFAFAPPPLYSDLSARETMRALSDLHPRSTVDTRAIDTALDWVGLRDRADDRVRVYSFGMRQRLALALALVPLPRVLVLDEPTDGLDPLAVIELRTVLERLRTEHGVAILLSSHQLSEAQALADELIVLSDGHTLYRGTVADLLAAGSFATLEDAVVARLRTARSGEGSV